MPIYEYRCKKCEKVFEKIQRVGGGGENLVCPHCGNKKVEKLVSGFSSKGSVSSSSCVPPGGSSRFT
jgi:putative FmdB family regulatory protein